ncbi:MAG: TIGR03560 family F420-dependent LLM class oxidoreductase [Anaerolineales bacterium]|nr:MAG: TIGR03560 family F420-dependent LLM class oxidoreductase [Anaerolineales bacterium]
MDIAIMIEGQDGLTWERWKRIAHAVEDLGFAGLYRSDHFTNHNPPEKESLELWISLAWLASHTERIDFGPLVTPASFRHPVFTAWMAKEVDALSEGRLVLGLGAGWQAREHQAFGFDLLPIDERFDRFQEALEVITRLLRADRPVDYNGMYYRLNTATLRPRPLETGRPPILIGGNGPIYTLPLVVQYADEWNGVYITPHRFFELNQELETLLKKAGRSSHKVRRSLMSGLVFGQNQAELENRLQQRGASAEELRAQGIIVGVEDEIVEQVLAFANAGVQRIMLQWLFLDDLDGLECLAELLFPAVSAT